MIVKITTKLWIGLVILIALTPLGLILPERFKTGGAWGEWGSQEIKDLVGYIPRGFEKLSRLWSAPVPDYAFKGWEGKGLMHLSVAYIVSAIAGIAIIVGLVFLLGRILTKKGD